MNRWATDCYQPKVLDESIMAFYRLQGLNQAMSENRFDTHSTYEIYVFEEGHCNYFIQDAIYDLQPGDIVLLDGLTLHKANTTSPETYVRSMVHFSPAWWEKIMSRLGMPNLLSPFQKMNTCILRTGFDDSGQYVSKKIRWLAVQLEEIHREFEFTGQVNVLLKAEIELEFLQLLMKIYKMSASQYFRVEPKNIEKKRQADNIASWINQHYCEKISLERIAKELNLSKYYISHLFKEVTGYTVMQYVMDCRLIQVKYLLEMQPNLPLEDIYISTGFESAAHFSRFFKERMGMTPTSYRKMKSGSKFVQLCSTLSKV